MGSFPHVDSLLAKASVDIARSLCDWDSVPLGDEPATLEAAIEHFQRTGRIAVTRAEDFGSGRLRLWGDALPWQAFFVWHDWCHVNVPHGTFDPEGEEHVHNRQVEQLLDWCNRQSFNVTKRQFARMVAVLEAHNIARLEHWRVFNEPPVNLREFAYGYLASRNLLAEEG